MKKAALIPDRIFTGENFLQEHAILVEEDKITNVIPLVELPSEIDQQVLKGKQIAPAFIDLQIYGGNGKMFSLFPTTESLTATYQYCIKGGASHFMATVATNSHDVMYKAIAAVKDYWEQGLPGLLGLHLEGPYLNPEKKGAHLTQYIKQPELQEVKDLLREGEGIIKMMTLAPECCSKEVIHLLLDEGVIVSAGHSNATYEQAMEAFELGIPVATHLYNAMSPLQHRAPGLVGAIFDGNIYSSIVVDGIHVDFAAVRIAKKIMKERLFLITDAITEASTDSYSYVLQNNRYVTENGTLAGSCLTQGKGVKNLIDHVHVEPGEALRMASLYPAKVIGADEGHGRIMPGYQADMVVLDEQFNVENIFLAGMMQ